MAKKNKDRGEPIAWATNKYGGRFPIYDSASSGKAVDSERKEILTQWEKDVRKRAETRIRNLNSEIMFTEMDIDWDMDIIKDLKKEITSLKKSKGRGVKTKLQDKQRTLQEFEQELSELSAKLDKLNKTVSNSKWKINDEGKVVPNTGSGKAVDEERKKMYRKKKK